ncbi:GPI inositol-deacylase isoform X1 [Pelodiscus sinensis]|uniref:GPI inositol-deacylase isoform X1 n=1 Tax=Pelodiscus sinensis TaxID=13735 RepID=UPI003F6B1B2C
MGGGAALFYGALAALALLGVRDVLFLHEENRCSMTYMYEYPEYLKIKLPKKISRRYPTYELYLYGEGNYAEENKNLILTGIPVLFLPGNGGSYKQVRSLGSIALRKAEDIDFKYHFNFYTVNFNEELVALYGGSLQRQTRFVHECIKVILKLYKDQEYAPKSVVIVGHSMGGLVARALLTLKNFKPELINLLITQATPHVAPVMPLDKYLTDFYTAVNNHWILKAQDVRNLTTLSVAGGFRDYQVRSGLAFLPGLSQHSSALFVVSSAVPRTWVSTDHLSIVWCKELILATIRAFFDLIDENTKQITEDPKKRMLVLNHHFVRYPAKFFEEDPETFTELKGTLIWIKIESSKWTYKVYNESDGKYFMFPLSNHRKTYSHVHCQSSMMDTNSWIYGCLNSSSSMCWEGFDLSWKAELLPTVKVVTLKLQEYPSLSNLVIYVPAINGNKFTLDCEFFKEDSRTVQLPVTHLFSFGLSSSKTVLNSTGLIYNVQLQHFDQIYQAFKIYIESHCHPRKERKTSVYRLHIPWSHEDSITVSNHIGEKSLRNSVLGRHKPRCIFFMDRVPSFTEISAKLHIAQPENDSTVAVLNIYSSSDCQYEVTIKTSFSQVLGQVIRFHSASLPVYIISNVLLAYGGQLSTLLSTGQCSDFVLALAKAAKPYKVDPIVNIVKFLLGFNWFKDLWNVLFLPELDAVVLNKQDMWFPLVSLILFLFGTGIAYWGGIFFSSVLRLLSSLWLSLTRPPGLPKDSKLMTLRRVFVAILLVFVSWTTCGAFAILIIYLHYMFKIVKLHLNVRIEQNVLNMGQKHSKETSYNSKNKTVKNCDSAEISPEASSATPTTTQAIDNVVNSLKIHITIINLLTWIVLLSLPSLIYWFKNLRYSIRLDPDPCRTTAIILVSTSGILMNSSTVKIKSSKLSKIAAQVPLPLSVAVVAFGPMHLYRVPYFVIFSLLLHVLCCIV